SRASSRPQRERGAPGGQAAGCWRVCRPGATKGQGTRGRGFSQGMKVSTTYVPFVLPPVWLGTLGGGELLRLTVHHFLTRLTIKRIKGFSEILTGAGGRSRTDMRLPSGDFESEPDPGTSDVHPRQPAAMQQLG